MWLAIWRQGNYVLITMKNVTAGTRGRPRSFDRDEALDIAMRLFWERGFEATSISDLAEAMKLNPPSLYAAFGDKKILFMQALERYQASAPASMLTGERDYATARQAIRALLENAACSFVDPAHPRGCMVVLSGQNCSAEADDIAAELRDRRLATEAAIAARLRRGIANGDVPPRTDVKGLAALVMTVLEGMSIQARDGATVETLKGIVRRTAGLIPSVL